MYIEELGQDFTWENTCEECFKEFECSKFIPKKIINKMIKENNDDVVHEYMGETDNNKVRICPSCRKSSGID